MGLFFLRASKLDMCDYDGVREEVCSSHHPVCSYLLQPVAELKRNPRLMLNGFLLHTLLYEPFVVLLGRVKLDVYLEGRKLFPRFCSMCARWLPPVIPFESP